MRFESISRLAVVLLAGMALMGCRSSRAASEIEQGTYYTKFALHFEKDMYRTTNYRRGVMLPINTEVTLLSNSGNRIVVRIEPEGRRLVVEHMARHTHDTLEEAFDKIFAKEPVDVSTFTPEEQEAIKEGKARVGMTKKAVLVAMGPPPASGTLSLESNAWRYWDTRWSSYEVRFDTDGLVTDAGR